MRRNMQEVLERWGQWAARDEYCSLLDWPTMSVIPAGKSVVGKSGCSDEDGFTIDSCIAHMSMVRSADDILILGLRFIGGRSTRYISEVMRLPRMNVRTSLRASEEFLEGCFVAMAIRLDMDPVVTLPGPLAGAQKPVLVF